MWQCFASRSSTLHLSWLARWTPGLKASYTAWRGWAVDLPSRLGAIHPAPSWTRCHWRRASAKITGRWTGLPWVQRSGLASDWRRCRALWVIGSLRASKGWKFGTVRLIKFPREGNSQDRALVSHCFGSSSVPLTKASSTSGGSFLANWCTSRARWGKQICSVQFVEHRY